MTPAIAPATALGRERVETLSTSALWRSSACAPLAPTARATGADWDALVVMLFSSGVVKIGVEAGWMVSGSCLSRSIVETPQLGRSCCHERFGAATTLMRSVLARCLPRVIDRAGFPNNR